MESQVEANLITTPGEASCQEHDRHGFPFRELRRPEMATGLIEAVPLSQALLERDPIEGTDLLSKESSALLGLDKRHVSEMILVANIEVKRGDYERRKDKRRDTNEQAPKY